MPRLDVARADRGPGAPGSEEAPWYAQSFGRDYLDLYRHRDQDEARLAVALVLKRLPLDPAATVLDLGCGAGRHLEELAARGLKPFGLDLSSVLLAEVRRHGSAVRLVRGDMRCLPFAEGVFDAVLSFFTSFGYFPEDRENLAVLRETSRVLRPGGAFLLDFLNRDHVLRQGAHETREVRGGRVIHQVRRVDPMRDTIDKTITISPQSGTGAVRSYRESVRLYSPARLTALAAQAGLIPVERCGSWSGAPFRTSAPRFILIARKQPN